MFVVYMVLGGAGRLMDRLRDETGPRFLRETVPTLLPWEPSRALRDMSSLVRRQRSSSGLGGGRAHARGTVQSLSNRRDAWLAYTVNTHRRLGTVTLHTSANTLLIEIARDESLPRGGRRASITVDGKPLGSVNLETSELFDAQRRPLGQLAAGRTLIMQGMTDYRTVEMGGRALAEINDEPLGPLDRPGPMPPAFRIHAPQLSADEQWWLVALLGLALYSDCLSPDV